MGEYRFSFGYRNRIIELHDLASFIEWNTDVDTLKIDQIKWKRVDLKLNEMKLHCGFRSLYGYTWWKNIRK